MEKSEIEINRYVHTYVEYLLNRLTNKQIKGACPLYPPAKGGTFLLQKKLCKMRKNLLTQLVKMQIEIQIKK